MLFPDDRDGQLGYKKTMIKNVILFLVLVAVIGGGIGYSFYSDPEQASIQLFDQAMNQFAKQAENLEIQYEKNGALSESTKILKLDTITSQESDANLVVHMTVASQYVTLVFSDGNWPLANQSIILEPFIPESSFLDKSVRWKCISGSVLVRLRNKNCRLGYGVSSSKLR